MANKALDNFEISFGRAADLYDEELLLDQTFRFAMLGFTYPQIAFDMCVAMSKYIAEQMNLEGFTNIEEFIKNRIQHSRYTDIEARQRALKRLEEASE